MTSMTVPAMRTEDEQAIRALQDIHMRGILTKDPQLRASTWTEDGTVAPPQGGFFRGRAAMARHFETELPSINNNSNASMSDYRFRFLTDDVAFVDALLTLNNIIGPDGQLHSAVKVSLAFTAVRKNGKWLVQDERAHFLAAMPVET